MGHQKPPERTKRRVWRISEAAPLGEVVDADDTPPARAEKDRPESPSGGGWVVSSFELLHGTEVSEDPDTVPDDLFDELFAPHDDARKPPSDK